MDGMDLQVGLGKKHLTVLIRDGQTPLFCPPSPKSKASPSGPSLNQAQILRTKYFWAENVFSLGSSEGVGRLPPGVSSTLKKTTPSALVVEPVAVEIFLASFRSCSPKCYGQLEAPCLTTPPTILLGGIDQTKPLGFTNM